MEKIFKVLSTLTSLGYKHIEYFDIPNVYLAANTDNEVCVFDENLNIITPESVGLTIDPIDGNSEEYTLKQGNYSCKYQLHD